MLCSYSLNEANNNQCINLLKFQTYLVYSTKARLEHKLILNNTVMSLSSRQKKGKCVSKNKPSHFKEDFLANKYKD